MTKNSNFSPNHELFEKMVKNLIKSLEYKLRILYNSNKIPELKETGDDKEDMIEFIGKVYEAYDNLMIFNKEKIEKANEF